MASSPGKESTSTEALTQGEGSSDGDTKQSASPVASTPSESTSTDGEGSSGGDTKLSGSPVMASTPRESTSTDGEGSSDGKMGATAMAPPKMTPKAPTPPMTPKTPKQPTPSTSLSPIVKPTGSLSANRIYTRMGIEDFDDRIKINSIQHCNMHMEIVEYKENLLKQLKIQKDVEKVIALTLDQITTTEGLADKKLKYVVAMRKRVSGLKREAKHREIVSQKAMDESCLLFDNSIPEDELLKSVEEMEKK